MLGGWFREEGKAKSLTNTNRKGRGWELSPSKLSVHGRVKYTHNTIRMHYQTLHSSKKIKPHTHTIAHVSIQSKWTIGEVFCLSVSPDTGGKTI